VDLTAWAGAVPTATILHEIADHLMLVLRDMLAEIRGGPPPPLWSGGRRGSADPAGHPTAPSYLAAQPYPTAPPDPATQPEA
jgi:hypothetical protein